LAGNECQLGRGALLLLGLAEGKSVEKANDRAISQHHSQRYHGNCRKRHYENHQKGAQDRLNSPQIAAAATPEPSDSSALRLRCAVSLTVPALTLALVSN
jgi:hypothetical protein